MSRDKFNWLDFKFQPQKTDDWMDDQEMDDEEDQTDLQEMDCQSQYPKANYPISYNEQLGMCVADHTLKFVQMIEYNKGVTYDYLTPTQIQVNIAPQFKPATAKILQSSCKSVRGTLGNEMHGRGKPAKLLSFTCDIPPPNRPAPSGGPKVLPPPNAPLVPSKPTPVSGSPLVVKPIPF